MPEPKVRVAILGSGNIGTDLMIKVLRTSQRLEMAALAGIDAASEGLARARRMGVATTHEGIHGLVRLPGFDDIKVVFDATSAAAHATHDRVLREHGKQVIDLTPAAIGPYTIPVVNLDEHLTAGNVNLVTCGGQATIPIVAAVGQVHPVVYAEIVSSIASRSAGPGTRANIDEFTVTTARAIERVGAAGSGKAIIILNPAEPPLLMRNTVFCLVEGGADTDAVQRSIREMVDRVQAYVPGYRLKQQVQFDAVSGLTDPRVRGVRAGTRVSVFLEVEGAAHYLPAYAGNLDIMTSAALKTAERIVELRGQEMTV
jgi:acetaldehyde dehydrogenase